MTARSTATEVLGALAKNDKVRLEREGILADAMVGIYRALDKSQREQLTKLVEVRGTKAVLGGGHGKHRDGDKAGRGKDAGGKDARSKGRQTKLDAGARDRAAARGKDPAAKDARKASRLARFSRVNAPVAKVGGLKGRS